MYNQNVLGCLFCYEHDWLVEIHVHNRGVEQVENVTSVVHLPSHLEMIK